MNCIKSLTVVMISTFLFIYNATFCSAADLIWHEIDKEEVFNMAKEQDRFVLLFVGNYPEKCGHCNRAFQYFNNPSGLLRNMIDDNYIAWFVPYYDKVTNAKRNLEQVAPYIADYEYTKYELGKSTTFPIIAVINPDDPDEDFTSFWSPGTKTEQQYYDFIAAPPDLFSGQKLKWYNDKSEVVKLAEEQGKNIFKFIGKPTSPNSKKVLKQLNTDPFKKILEDHYILWFSSDVSEVPVYTYAGETGAVSLPYITILDAENPDQILAMLWGMTASDGEAMEEMLNTHAVSNEWIASDIHVTVFGNILQISNRTNNEQIRVFTLNGQLIASIRKNEYTVTIETSNFPKGVLIAHSSTGWSRKVIVQ